ncbi:MAG: hypothetical protein V3U02_04500 [Calditrichia bacterium]
MVKLNDPRNVKVVELPSFPGSKIEIYDSLLTRESREVSKKGGDDFDKMVNGLELVIKSWNFTDDDNKVLPVNQENIGKLPSKDLQALAESLLTEEMKKKIEKNTSSSAE